MNGVLFPAGAQAALQIALRTGVIYLVVLIGVRLSGKREVGQMTPFDLTLLLLISNSVQNAMTGPDTSLVGGVIAASTLLLLNYAIGNLSGASRRFRRVVEGEPSLLVHDGKAIETHMAENTSAWTNCSARCASTALRICATLHWPCWKWTARSVA
ncbi:MAG: hypothetical protein WAM04_20565 [Candidatus Sulfotelmatobacter sp.]